MAAPLKGVYRGLAPGAFPSHDQYYRKVLYYRPIAYWPLWETSGMVARCLVNTAQNGTYTGVTLGQAGIGDGNTCPLFDGANDYCDIYTAAFKDAFALYNDPTGLLDESEGTVMVWAKVANAGVWTDGADRFLLQLAVDANNRLLCAKTITNNRLFLKYAAGGAFEDQAINGMTTIEWMCLGMTWSKSAGANGEVKHFLNGVQQGATDTALGVWVGNLAAAATTIGASSTGPAEPWHGWLAHCAVWDTPLTPTQIADLAVV